MVQCTWKEDGNYRILQRNCFLSELWVRSSTCLILDSPVTLEIRGMRRSLLKLIHTGATNTVHLENSPGYLGLEKQQRHLCVCVHLWGHMQQGLLLYVPLMKNRLNMQTSFLVPRKSGNVGPAFPPLKGTFMVKPESLVKFAESFW